MPNRLKGYRVMARFTQKEMAKEISMPLQTYIYKESGKGEFTVDEAKKIYIVLNKRINVSYEEIFLKN